MDPLLVELVKQLPTVAAILWLSREQALERKRRDEAQDAKDEKDAAALVDLGKGCHAFQHELQQKNEAMWSRVQTMMDEVQRALGGLNRPATPPKREPRV